MTVAGVTTVPNVTDGGLHSGSVSPTGFKVMSPTILNEDNSGLYAPLGFNNVSDVDLSNSSLLVTKPITGKTSSSGTLQVNVSDTGISSAFYSSFDAERYSVHYNDGAIEDLTEDQFTLTNAGLTATLTGLRAGITTSNVVVHTSVRKNSIQSKQKVYVRSEKATVNKTVVGVSTVSNGLTENNFYGLRVQDEEISLNVPDVVDIPVIIPENPLTSLTSLIVS